MAYLKLNEDCTELTLACWDDLSDYDNPRLEFDLDNVKELISDLQTYVGMMRIDVRKNEIKNLRKQRAEIDARLKELGE